ncbi:MAG TPA: leucyl aminopeptidase [Solirubrobacteraceae bacterium]|nr:leucyl aminopeptidase [Solirubrobacteraceae bacterium]
MDVTATTDAPADTGADTIAVGIFEDEGVAHDVEGGALQALIDAGEARHAFRKLAVTHAQGRRYVLAGLGRRDQFDPERARVAASDVQARAAELGARHLCWELPHHLSDAHAKGVVEGTIMAAYDFRAYKSGGDEDEERRAVERLSVSAHHDVSAPVARGHVVAEAANAARDLQNTPANDMTPRRLAERARALAAEHDALSVEVMGRAEIEAAGMGAFAGVARGTHEEPQLITLRHEAADARGPVLGLVGKAVTFDSGGISIKPGAKMSDMKFDMSGGAAVLEATGAIARLGLPVRLVSVIGATENLPSGHAMKPGDIVRASTGTTIEVINTDAEGRLVLADCLAHAVGQGAERLVDVATLTGAIVTTFGATHAGLMGTDDDWCGAVAEAGARSGELVWRLPLHPEYAEQIKGRYGDIVNAVENRKAGSITAAEFLHRFVGDVPWAHLDIAGVAWDTGKAYAAKGGTGFGVRLLVELAAGGERSPDEL